MSRTKLRFIGYLGEGIATYGFVKKKTMRIDEDNLFSMVISMGKLMTNHHSSLYHMSRGKNPRTSVKLHHTGLQDFTDVHHNMTSLQIMIDIQ